MCSIGKMAVLVSVGLVIIGCADRIKSLTDTSEPQCGKSVQIRGRVIESGKDRLWYVISDSPDGAKNPWNRIIVTPV